MHHGFARDEVTLDGEAVVDCGVGGNEALGLALGFEALHLALSSRDRKMRVRGPVVVAQLAGPNMFAQHRAVS